MSDTPQNNMGIFNGYEIHTTAHLLHLVYVPYETKAADGFKLLMSRVLEKANVK